MRENFDHFYLQEHVKLCHFRNHYEVRLTACVRKLELNFCTGPRSISARKSEFCFFRQLTRKNLMVKNLKRLRKQIEREHGKTAATKYLLLKILLSLN